MFIVLVLLSSVVVLSAAAFAVSRFLRLVADAGATAAALGESLDAIAAGAERAASRGETIGAAGARLERSLGRLGRSRARLGVLLEAYAEARTALSTLVFIPRK